MDKVKLSKDIEVSNICLGAMDFGTRTSEKDAFDILDLFIERGGNFIDTSNNYAHWAGTGDESETVLGKWISERGCRDKIILATKVGFDRHGEGAGLRASQIEYWIDESLRKLRTDYVDVYYAHTDDENTPIEETMRAFDTLVKKGKVRMLGGSNYDTWRFAEANTIARDEKLTPYSVMQQNFTYLKARIDMVPAYKFNEHTTRERLRYLANKNIPLVAYSSLAKGAYVNPDRLSNVYVKDGRLETLLEMAKNKGVSPIQLVIAWMVNLYRCDDFPRVIPLFASSSTKHFGENLDGADIVLTDEEMNILNKA